VLSPLLYSLYTHDDTKLVGLIADDETDHREEVRALEEWCQDNSLFLNVSKTKEVIVDYSKQGRLFNLSATEEIWHSPSDPQDVIQLQSGLCCQTASPSGGGCTLCCHRPAALPPQHWGHTNLQGLDDV
jgi:hypothetical protein